MGRELFVWTSHYKLFGSRHVRLSSVKKNFSRGLLQFKRKLCIVLSTTGLDLCLGEVIILR